MTPGKVACGRENEKKNKTYGLDFLPFFCYTEYVEK